MATSTSLSTARTGWAHDDAALLGFARRVGLVRCGTNFSTICGGKMTMTWNNDVATMRLRALLMVLLFVALVSWEDAAQDQHRRMHGDDAGGAGCAMWIDYGLK